MFHRGKQIAVLTTALALAVGACDDAGNGTGSEFGMLTLQLTDAPGAEVVEAWVTFTHIYLQALPGDEDPDNGRIYLLEDGNETEELLSLANAVSTIVADELVPTGRYDQLRVVMSGACLVTDAGMVYASDDSYDLCGPSTGHLQMPSMRQSGAKVQLNGLEVAEGRQVWLLDFSVEESFGHQAGKSGKWVMNPVIHTSRVEFTSDIEVTLDEGDVTLPDGFDLGQFSATLLPAVGDSSRVDFEDKDEDGIFELGFRFLIPDNGPFDVRLNGPESLTWTVDPDSPQTVDLDSGETVSVDWVLQSATEDTGG